MPLRDAYGHLARRPARGAGGVKEGAMTQFSIDRRSLFKGAGALIVSIGIPGAVATAEIGSTVKPPLSPDRLDSWLAVKADGDVVAYFGKMDMGQGVDVAIAQIVADELDVPFERVSIVMGDTAWTVNQGGASGSTGIQKGGIPLRNAAAEARRMLVELASQRLGVPAERLEVTDGVVIVTGDPARKLSYGELIGGRYFDLLMTWNGKIGNDLLAEGQAKPKPPSAYKIVGRSPPRFDVPAKVFGKLDYVTDIKVPGMLHGRMIRPLVAGALPVAVDDGSVRDLPGVRVIRDKGFIGIVTEREWDAVQAAERLHVTWSEAVPPFPEMAALYDHIRQASVVKREVQVATGEIDPAFANAARIVEAEYEWPFQSHASMGPACAVVDAQADGATLWTGSQKPHFARDGVARALGLPQDKVHGIWVPGPGSYGRNDAGDAGIDAALLSKAVGRPVRVQGMRYEGHGWDPKGPASIHRARAALDKDGLVIGYVLESKGFSRIDIDTNESDPSYSLAGQLMGLPLKSLQGFGVPTESYGFANKQLAWETIAPLLERASPLRTAHLRDPVGPQIQFASESFIDEIAAAIGADPVAFRLRYLKAPRDIAVVKAAAERAQWDPRPSPRPDRSGDTLSGRGIAYAQRSGAVVAIVAEVEIDRRSGKVWARKFTVAHDCGLIVNPDGLRRCIEGNVVQGTSRALSEEVAFDRAKVTSTDWLSYPILDITEAPEAVDIVLINRPELPPAGAGESSIRPVAAALANAVFDATGVRLRRAPLTPERLKPALA
jgi:CO/xanthine dehydrogenase Mo-binding subunit